MGNATQIYEIKNEDFYNKQRNRSAADYAQTLQKLWQELDHCEHLETNSNEDAVLLRRYKEKGRIYKFLEELNSEFDLVRVQVLGKELSSLNKTMAVLRGEVSQRRLMLKPTAAEISALTTQSNGRKPDPFGGMGGGKEAAMGDKDSLWRTYSKKEKN